jgi:hypothetical protein
LESGIFEITTTSVIRSAAMTTTKMSKSRMISAIDDSIIASNRA